MAGKNLIELTDNSFLLSLVIIFAFDKSVFKNFSPCKSINKFFFLTPEEHYGQMDAACPAKRCTDYQRTVTATEPDRYIHILSICVYICERVSGITVAAISNSSPLKREA
jgi:hypothetical protein